MKSPDTPAGARLPSDTEIIGGIVGRDPSCLDQLYGRYALAVFSLASRIARDRSLAEEVTQDVFMQVWRDAASYDPARGSMRVWILTIARARTLDRLRSRQIRNGRTAPVEAADQHPAEASPSPEASAAATEGAALVDTVLSVLPAADRRLIHLAYFSGFTQSEIAAHLEQPLGTIKTQMRRILRLLRSAVREDVIAPPFSWHAWATGTPAPPPIPVDSLQNVNILAVDDDADTLKLLTLVLQRAGANVVPASSAVQALKRVDVIWPDIIVTDLEMPGQDGCALLEQVRARAAAQGRRIPAVVFTAHSGERDRSRTADAGFDLHLPKPVRPALLVSKVTELIRAARPRTLEEF